ncbi:hypothetical protein FH972_022926 [Carpinus fangiana]|uniref:Adenylate cyclase n=1 Tax=Carpinus fangiana TaxID=176857 RepID=A0A5N6KU17_9ROSI|nr:hypothetical protein FH972_022926 [Carpinus fangiana]
MPVTGARHGSSSSTGAQSWHSDDTVKGGAFDNVRGTPVKIFPHDRSRFEYDAEVSPGSRPATSPGTGNDRFDIAPWDDDEADTFNDRMRGIDAAVASNATTSTMRTGSVPVTPGWSGQGSSSSSAGGAGHLNPSQQLWGRLQSTPNIAQDFKSQSEDRRPSAASGASTVSSTDSSSRKSQTLHKKLQGFFGEDPDTAQTPTLPPSSPTTPSERDGPRGRQSYFNIGSALPSTQPSPGPSRPRSPQPSSEVTPWLFQDAQDISHFGDAPIREDLQEPLSERNRQQSTAKVAAKESQHRLHLPGHAHRHRRDLSSEKSVALPSEGDFALSAAPRSETFPALRRNTSHTPSAPLSRTTSDMRVTTMSSQTDGVSADPKGSSSKPADSSHHRRSLLDRIRHRNKGGDKAGIFPDGLKSLGASSASLQQQSPDQTPKPAAPGRQNSVADATMGPALGRVSTFQGKHGSRLPFKSKRGLSSDIPIAKDPNYASSETNATQALWNLDTDLSRMEGIVSDPNAPPPVVKPSASALGLVEEVAPESVGPDGQAAWDAPDSWAVKRVDHEAQNGKLEDEKNVAESPDGGMGIPFCIRIFRSDSTFATLSIPYNTTVAEMIQILGKKTLPKEDLNSHHIIMRKHDTSRQLEPGERPIAIQRKLLEQAGYNEADRIEELGREDHSYLCRFNFLPASMVGYSSLEKDPGFNKMQKFVNIDLAGRNLITIPIALYQKNSEIVFLNLSRNLSLDVPKDFIQGCTGLREIRFTGNEAWRLPASFSLASKLTVLDISNNRLESLEQADLHKLEALASLRLANNRLTSIPAGFAQFKSLRSLDLSSNFLPDLPEAVCDIITLVDLNISFNALTSLPHIGRLENLEKLWCNNNKLSGRREDTIANLTNLREVDIRFNATDNIDALSKLPNLDTLMAGHNLITSFDGSFAKIRVLYLDHNPITRFTLSNAVPTLSTLSLASAQIAQLPDELFQSCPSLTRLILNKNHLAALTPQIGLLQKLEHLSIAKNALSTLPTEIGRLVELRFLDARENNINLLPPELWYCRKLETLNLSSNILDAFPKPPTHAALAGLDQLDQNGSLTTPISTSPSQEELDQLGDFPPPRRLSAASGYMSIANSSPGNTARKNSVASMYGQSVSSRKPSILSRTPTESMLSSQTRKGSIASSRSANTMTGSLRQLLLADNRLQDEVFEQIASLPDLRVINLSYNELYEIPHRTLRRLPGLSELYLSGNDLSSLPTDDLEELGQLKVLHINNNKFQVLPAELGKARRLTVLDVASNSLKYNLANWPYDWNWNCNPNLKHLTLSGNKRLEIKPQPVSDRSRQMENLTDFSVLHSLRILGLMDVTLMTEKVPDQSEDRRVRTSGSAIGTMSYGMADYLGRNEHLSTWDFVVPRLSHDDEIIIGLFDGVAQANSGSKIVKYLQENFRNFFEEEMRRKQDGETPLDALRRTYLALNKELAGWATSSPESKDRRSMQSAHRGSITTPTLSIDDLQAGAVATIFYIHGMDLYVSNIGDAQALLIQSEGSHRLITQKHDPADAQERQRIREAGGYVSRQGKLNDVLDVSRAFGFIHMTPVVIAAPYLSKVSITESDEIILLASRELWEYLTPGFAVDLARSERGDLMRAAQKLRDLAIAFGASGKITVMLIGVSDLRKKERARYRTHSMSMGPSGLPDEFTATRRGKRGRDTTLDSKLARLDQEVEAPVGEITLVFTDIKNSTLLWETYPTAMRSAIKQHNELMRRQLRLIGGYEVKTEGDSFMVAFPTVTSALLWCFTIQALLLDVEWPQEILSSVSGQEVCDSDGTILFKGLSVRMGAHWGQPVCEVDPVTRRMDYFGPMVNRAARIASVADGGQITVSSDFIAEVQRLLETHIETDRSNSASSEDQMQENLLNETIRRELRSLSSHGFEVKDLGERRLKGLENPEYIYLMYPHTLAGRLVIQQQRLEAEKASSENQRFKSRDSQLTIDLDNVWDLWNISLRLEMLCSTLECRDAQELKPPETALLERTKERGGEVTDRFLVNFVEHQVSRIETCINTLALRNLVYPFKDGILSNACPIGDIFKALAEQLSELNTLKASIDIDMADA